MKSKIILSAVIMILTSLITGCAATMPVPKMTDSQRSAIGIQVATQPPMGFTSKPDRVYFIKINDEDGIEQNQVIPSNFAKDGRIYLLNVKPGKYAAVADLRAQSGSPGGGGGISLSMGSLHFITYYPKELIEATTVNVGTGEVVFIGNYLVGQAVGLDNAEALQNHYAELISPGEPKSGLAMTFSGNYHYRGTIIKNNHDDNTKAEFMKNAKEDLKEGGWGELIK